MPSAPLRTSPGREGHGQRAVIQLVPMPRGGTSPMETLGSDSPHTA